jgi:GNAT superfamily N-acetyltransferase
MRHQLTIRPAQQADREEVFKFCQDTFEWGDYIPNVWDKWLKEKHAQLLTALLQNKPVGIMRVAMLKPGEAWLQAARTHPRHRRRGIATALTDACLRWAKSKGAKTARLATESSNIAAQKVLEKLHFTQVCDFLILKCEKLQPEESEGSKWARRSDAEKTWEYLAKSGIFRESGGLYTTLYTWMSLQKQDLVEFIAKEKVIVHKSNNTTNGLVLIDETVRDVWPEKPFQTCYVDGDREGIVDMMRFFKSYAHNRGVTTVYAFACNSPEIANALTAVGFNREDHVSELVYEEEIALVG